MALDLAFDTLGSGPPLLLLHGLFGSGRNWRGIARELAATHTVYSVDLRNHGGSPWAEAMDYPAMADDVSQLIDRLGLNAPAVLGHSMGGKTAMALALRHPDRVGRLIVVDIAPVGYADLPNPPMPAFPLQSLAAPADHCFDWRVNLFGICAAMPQLCAFPQELLSARFDGPTTVIAGARSGYVSDPAGSQFRPMFDAAAVEVIADAGHWLHADAPAALLARVRRALQRDPPPHRFPVAPVAC